MPYASSCHQHSTCSYDVYSAIPQNGLAPNAIPPQREPFSPLPDGRYEWLVTPEQAAHLTEQLSTPWEEIGVDAAILAIPQVVCVYCGKLSGMDDIIGDALAVHDPEFLVKMLIEGAERDHSHVSHCSGCGAVHLAKGSNEEIVAEVSLLLFTIVSFS